MLVQTYTVTSVNFSALVQNRPSVWGNCPLKSNWLWFPDSPGAPKPMDVIRRPLTSMWCDSWGLVTQTSSQSKHYLLGEMLWLKNTNGPHLEHNMDLTLHSSNLEVPVMYSEEVQIQGFHFQLASKKSAAVSPTLVPNTEVIPATTRGWHCASLHPSTAESWNRDRCLLFPFSKQNLSRTIIDVKYHLEVYCVCVKTSPSLLLYVPCTITQMLG